MEESEDDVSLWWAYPGEGWGIAAIVLMWAWVWVALWGLTLGVAERCYHHPGLSIWVLGTIVFFLAMTCGGRALRWLHGPLPWVLLWGTLLVVVVPPGGYVESQLCSGG